MKKFNSLHLDIADILINCSKNRTTICYSDLCKKVHYPSLHQIGKELEKISLFTYEKYRVFLSVLVVQKETQDSDNPTPSSGFFTMYLEKNNKPNLNLTDEVRIQREKVFNQDWSGLLDLMREEMK